MGWGVDFKANIYLKRQEYNKNKFLVQDAIAECKVEINNIISHLHMLGASTPKDVVPEDYKEDILNWIHQEIENSYDQLKESIVKEYQHGLYLEYLEETEKISPPTVHSSGSKMEIQQNKLTAILPKS